MRGTNILGIIFKNADNVYEYWKDFTLSEEDENTIMNILSNYETDGCSLCGTKEEIVAEISRVNKGEKFHERL